MISFIYSLETVKNLDIEKFMGKWYVISSIPNYVEKNCQNAFDIYTLNDDGTIDIHYYAYKNNKPFTIHQRGVVTDTINNSTWKINFLDPWIPFYSAPYEVIVLDQKNYKYMVVGYPGNDYGWIMSRSNTMNDTIYFDILTSLKVDFNYDINQFEKIIHTNYKPYPIHELK